MYTLLIFTGREAAKRQPLKGTHLQVANRELLKGTKRESIGEILKTLKLGNNCVFVVYGCCGKTQCVWGIHSVNLCMFLDSRICGSTVGLREFGKLP